MTTRGAALGAVLALFVSPACTTRETGSIDLAASATPPKPPKPPKPMPAATCAADEDCAEPAKPHCDLESEKCVECLVDADCVQDPMRPFCDVSHGHCVACITEGGCPPDPMCPMCKPMP